MEVERINDQTAVIHLPVTVDIDDAPRVKQLSQTLYEEGVPFIQVDFTVMHIPAPGLDAPAAFLRSESGDNSSYCFQ